MAAIPYAHVTQGPAVLRPAGPPVVTRERRISPIWPLCCIALILFLIASTIVLSLIPVYIERRGERVDFESVQYNALYRINNGTLPVGALTQDNTNAIETDQHNLVRGNRDVSPSSPDVTEATDTGNTTIGRRRRQSDRAEGNLISVTGFLAGAGRCRRGSCLFGRGERFIALLLGRGTFYLTLAGANGTRFVFSITVISASLSPTPGGSSQNASLTNDIAILNFALVLELLEANFYQRFQNNFTSQDFIAAGFSQETYNYFNLISSHENAHVRILRTIIPQLGGTPVPECTYNFDSVTNVTSYVTLARIFENTGTMAYDGAANGLADTTLREMAATVATVEGRHAAYLNLIQGVSPFPNTFENATPPEVVIEAIRPYLGSCPFTLTAPIVPYIGSSSFSGSIPTSNNTAVSPYTNIAYVNDLRVLNYALVAEQLEATFYNTYVGNFTSTDFTSNNLTDATNFFIMIREIENAHVQFLRMIITQRGGTPVPLCTYNFNVTNVLDFVRLSRTFENTGVSAYDGSINRITDPSLILGAATIATVEARFASFLNRLSSLVPFPNATDPTLEPAEVVAILSAYQTCPFTPDLPVVLSPSSFTPNLS